MCGRGIFTNLQYTSWQCILKSLAMSNSPDWRTHNIPTPTQVHIRKIPTFASWKKKQKKLTMRRKRTEVVWCCTWLQFWNLDPRVLSHLMLGLTLQAHLSHVVLHKNYKAAFKFRGTFCFRNIDVKEADKWAPAHLITKQRDFQLA
jgi:hypothetical protein